MNEPSGNFAGPPILYIAGPSRSGSTLLADLLGQLPGAVSVGEIRHLQTYLTAASLPANTIDPDAARRCGCGQPLSECEFWKRVEARAQVSLEDIQLRSRAGRLRRRLVQALYLAGGPKAIHVAAVLPFIRSELQVAENNFRLFDTLSALTEACVIIDSDKELYHYILLHSFSPRRMRLLLLTRDGRGVVHSEIRGKRSARFDLRRGSPLEQAIRAWKRTTYSALLFSFRTPARNRFPVRYEDICRSPAPVINEVREHFGISTAGFVPSAQRAQQHAVGGSPGRFDRGNREVVFRESWRSGLTAGQLRTFARLAGRLNARLGYR